MFSLMPATNIDMYFIKLHVYFIFVTECEYQYILLIHLFGHFPNPGSVLQLQLSSRRSYIMYISNIHDMGLQYIFQTFFKNNSCDYFTKAVLMKSKIEKNQPKKLLGDCIHS